MKNTSKKIFIAILSVLLILSCVLPAFAAENNEDLPHIARWVNGKAAGADGAFIYDSWAVDDTNLSDSKFVLVNQEGTETMRIKNYPDDINGGESVTLNSYNVELTIKPPKDVESEIILTFENKNALYYVYFNEQNSYTAITPFLPGEYMATYVDVVTDTAGNYGLKDDFKLLVKDKAVKDKVDIVRINSDSEKVNAETEKKQDIGTGIKNFDSNGDLLTDTLAMFIGMAIIFAFYLYIKRRREKAQEINKKNARR